MVTTEMEGQTDRQTLKTDSGFSPCLLLQAGQEVVSFCFRTCGGGGTRLSTVLPPRHQQPGGDTPVHVSSGEGSRLNLMLGMGLMVATALILEGTGRWQKPVVNTGNSALLQVNARP